MATQLATTTHMADQVALRQLQTRQELQQVLKEAGSQLVVVNFFAPWCGPCRKMTPEFERLSREAKFAEMCFFCVDTVENVETAEYYNINVLPTFILYRNGLKVERFTGADPAKLEAFLEAHVQ